MTIVARQYNLLAEQLRRGIAGFAENKLRESELETQKAKVAYGIKRDEREMAIANRRMEMQEDEFAAGKYEREMKLEQRKQQENLQATPATIESVSKFFGFPVVVNPKERAEIIGPAARDKGWNLDENGELKTQSGSPVSMWNVVNSPDFFMRGLAANNIPWQEKSVEWMEPIIEEYDKTGKLPEGITEENIDRFKQEYSFYKKNISDFKKDPASYEMKKLEKMQDIFMQIKEPREIEKMKVLLDKQAAKIKELVNADLAKEKTLREEPKEYTYSTVDDITGKVNIGYAIGTKTHVPKEKLPPNAQWGIQKEQKPKYQDPSDKADIQNKINILMKARAVADARGGAIGLDSINLTKEELSAFSDFPSAVASSKDLTKQIEKLQVLKNLPPFWEDGQGNRVRLDLDFIANIMRRTDWDFDEVVRQLTLVEIGPPKGK